MLPSVSAAGDGETVRERRAVRAIVITPEHDVLLLRIRPPGRSDSFWITPGGGLEPGETDHSGLRRELLEELGLRAFEIGPLVWLRQDTFRWAGKRIRQSERYYIVQVERFVPAMSDQVEAQVVQEIRWWSMRELGSATEPVTPLALATIVSDYLANGPPREPLALELLVEGAPNGSVAE